MARVNYSGEKRRKELEKQRKKEEKKQRKLANSSATPDESTDTGGAPADVAESTDTADTAAASNDS